MNYLSWSLLKFLSDGESHLAPKGVGPKTVDLCVQNKWVSFTLVSIKKDGVESSCMPLRITKEGRIIYLVERSRATGRVPKELVEHRLKQLRKLIGTQVVRSLQRGMSVVKEWRRTTPHNWWVENRKGDVLWHSNDRERPDILMLEIVAHSENKIVTGSWLAGGDEGKPEESTYRLKKIYC